MVTRKLKVLMPTTLFSVRMQENYCFRVTHRVENSTKCISTFFCSKKLRLSNNSWWLIPDTEITDSRISGDFSIAGVPLQFDVSKLSWYYENAVYRGRPVRNAHVKTDKKVKDILKQKDTLKSLLIVSW